MMEPEMGARHILLTRSGNMGILGFLLLGLIAGAIAKAILPGRQGGGWIVTLVLGVVGAILGGWIGSLIFGGGLGDFFDLRTWLLSILGAVIVLLIYGAVTRRSRVSPESEHRDLLVGSAQTRAGPTGSRFPAAKAGMLEATVLTQGTVPIERAVG